MALSPWMPATFIWLAIDGLLGFRPQVTELSVQPHLPESWQWLAIKNVPYRGRHFSLFYHLGTIYSSQQVDTGCPLELYDEDVSDMVESNAYVIALRRGDEVVLFIGVPERQGVTLSLRPPLVSQEQRFDFLMNPGEAQVLTVQVPSRSWTPGATPEEAAVPEPVAVTAAPLAEAMGFGRGEDVHKQGGADRVDDRPTS